MPNPDTTKLDQILYAQALHIAVTLSDKKPNFGAVTMDILVEQYLESHRNLANQVYRYIRSQQG